MAEVQWNSATDGGPGGRSPTHPQQAPPSAWPIWAPDAPCCWCWLTCHPWRPQPVLQQSPPVPWHTGSGPCLPHVLKLPHGPIPCVCAGVCPTPCVHADASLSAVLVSVGTELGSQERAGWLWQWVAQAQQKSSSPAASDGIACPGVPLRTETPGASRDRDGNSTGQEPPCQDSPSSAIPAQPGDASTNIPGILELQDAGGGEFHVSDSPKYPTSIRMGVSRAWQGTGPVAQRALAPRRGLHSAPHGPAIRGGTPKAGR